jgi:hypothetical protein
MRLNHRVRVMPSPAGPSGEVPYDRPAPCKRVAYRCARGHAFEVTFAATADMPSAWECRCGSGATLAGEAVLAAATTAAQLAQSEHERHLGQLLQRRSVADLEQLLDARIAELAAQRRESRQ